MKKLFLATLMFTLGGIAQKSFASVTATISDSGDAVHFELSGQDQWEYDVQRQEKNGKVFVQMTVPKLKETTVQNLNRFHGSGVVTGVKVSEGPDGKSLISFALPSKQIESFDYQTEQPSKLVVDFYKNEDAEPTKKISTQVNKEQRSTKAVSKKTKDKTSEVAEKLPNKRDVASEVVLLDKQNEEVVQSDKSSETIFDKEKKAGIFDGGDPNFERFSIKDYEIKEDAIIASQMNVYLDFPVLKVPNPYFDKLNTHQPVYQILPEDTDENKMARLLLTLFEKKRYAVYLKTRDWFREKYPDSKYDEIVRFMSADVYYNLWLEKRKSGDYDLAMLNYRQAMDKYPTSKIAERTSILMGFAALDKGDVFSTLKQFSLHLSRRPDSSNRDIAKLAVAEAYLKLNRYEEALATYDEIEKTSKDEKYRAEAAYLRGDVYFQKKEFKSAIAEYKNASKKNPKFASDFPNAYFNQAEAFFKLKDYRLCLDTDREFLIHFPAHPYAGYAMTRIGENLEILGADKKKIQGVFLETAFRYGDSPSAVVARLRMLSDRMGEMKEKDVENAVKEMNALVKKAEIPKIEQFATLEIAEGYSHRKEYEKSIELLAKYYQGNPTTADTKLLSSRIEKNINDEMRDAVAKSDFIQVLQIHNKYGNTWLKSSDRIDTKYYLGQAFEQAGVFKEADRYYRETLNKIYSVKGTRAEKERNIFEKLPSEQTLNLRLAANSFSDGTFSQAYDFLKTIKKPELLTDREQVERVQLASSLLEKKGDNESAVRYLTDLIKTWEGRPDLEAEPYLQLAQIERKVGKKEAALSSLRKIDDMQEDSQKVNPITHEKALMMMGDLELELNRSNEAAETFENLLELYETVRPLTSVRYKLGQIYFKRGEIQKASETWKDLKGKQNDFWFNLAQEQLKNSEWNQEYKKYIKRIPAMVGKTQENKAQQEKKK